MTTRSQAPTFSDPIVAETRKARDEMAREANYDLHVLCERLRKDEREHLGRMLKRAATKRAVRGE